MFGKKIPTAYTRNEKTRKMQIAVNENAFAIIVANVVCRGMMNITTIDFLPLLFIKPGWVL